MDLDRFIVLATRAVATLIGLLGSLSIRAGERIKAWQQARGHAVLNQPVRASGGVPAHHSVTPAAASSPAVAGVPLSVRASEASPAASPVPTEISPVIAPPASVEGKQVDAPDELDWAGSLNHAAVAGLHLGQVLAMVRAGWLVPDETHLVDVGAALDAMEAFQDRTASAIAPVLEAMTDDQRAEFFGDFGADFPPDLPELERTP